MFSILDGDWLEERPGCPGLQREALPLPGSALPSSPLLPPTASSRFCSSSHDWGWGRHWEQTQTFRLFWKTGEGGTVASAGGRGGARMPATTSPNALRPLHGGGGSPCGSGGLSAETDPLRGACAPGRPASSVTGPPPSPAGPPQDGQGRARCLTRSPGEASPCLPPAPGRHPAGGPPCPQQCSCAKELVPSQHAVLNLTNLPTKLNRGGRS